MTTTKAENRLHSSIEKFILHLHPTKIDNRALKFSRTFGLGGILALLFVVLGLTGLLLRFSYVPTVQGAYSSIVALQNDTIFGHFIRNVHHLSAKLMVAVALLHLIRTYYSQAIFKKRAENWIYGLILMFMVLVFSFTGYLLPWDQLAYWAVTVITQMIEFIPFVGHALANMVRGSTVVDGNTLLNFYTLHTGVLPLLFILLMSMHFWLVRKAGGVALPASDNKVKVNVIPHLVWIEVIVAAITIAILFIFSAFYHAPLLQEANPFNSPDPSKAPWYFLGVQELLLHLHPIFSAIILPLCVTIFLFYMPYFKYNNLNVGVWFNSPLGKKMTIYSAILSSVFTFGIIYLLEHFLHLDMWFSYLGAWVATGLIPFLMYVVPMLVYLMYWKKKHGAKTEEMVMAVTTILLSSYLVMMLISLLLRGKGMLMTI